MAVSSRRMRPVRLNAFPIVVGRGDGDAVYMAARDPLGPYPQRMTERLEHWAAVAPDRVFLAQRNDAGGWETVTYAAALARVRPLAQALLDRGLSADRPLAILSGNSVEHGLLGLAAMYAGVTYAPIAPAYSLQAREYGTLGYVVERLQPHMVFAADGAAFERALRSVLPAGVELVVSRSRPTRLPATWLGDSEATPVTPLVAEARAQVGPDTIAKVLFTSGSTGRPKGVINTQRMLCSNQAMILSVMAFLADEPPVLCDWLPWNHTAGGNHNFGIALYNGGTFYIDEGKPTPGAFDATLRNLREIAATAHFTVPRTYDMLLPHLRADPALRECFFRRLKLLFYAAAGLTARHFEELSELALETCGEDLLWMTGFGATETAPFALCTGPAGATAGMIGWPAPGMELKLAPVGSKLEARVRGPNVTPGYWRDDDLTRRALDEEGFYRMGDAMRFADPADPAKGLLFDGRLAEDFKLSSGTWVSVGPLRARILARAGGCAQDVVVAGHDRAFVAVLIFPNLAGCRRLAADLPADAPAAAVVEHACVREKFQAVLAGLAREATGSSTFAARAMLLAEPPSLDARETTDKGSLNQRAVLQHRAALVDEIYGSAPSPRVIVV